MKSLSPLLQTTVQRILQWDHIDFELGVIPHTNSVTLRHDYYIVVITLAADNECRRHVAMIDCDDSTENRAGVLEAGQIENCGSFYDLLVMARLL